jgi:hypothetical protein
MHNPGRSSSVLGCIRADVSSPMQLHHSAKQMYSHQVQASRLKATEWRSGDVDQKEQQTVHEEAKRPSNEMLAM